MKLTLDHEQAQVVREILEGTLIQLRIESARAEAPDFRELLEQRERLVARTLAQLSDAPTLWAS
jgi:hypothetical protein